MPSKSCYLALVAHRCLMDSSIRSMTMIMKHGPQQFAAPLPRSVVCPMQRARALVSALVREFFIIKVATSGDGGVRHNGRCRHSRRSARRRAANTDTGRRRRENESLCAHAAERAREEQQVTAGLSATDRATPPQKLVLVSARSREGSWGAASDGGADTGRRRRNIESL